MPKIIDHNARRRDIAKAAVTVIGENGIDNTRLVDVAREAKATTGAITHYFEGKDAVLLAALDHVAQNILLLVQSHEGVSDREQIIDNSSLALAIGDNGRRDWRVWLAFFSRAVGDPALARINNAYYEEFRTGLSKVIRELQKNKKLSMSIDADIVADAIITAVDGLGVRASLDPDNWPPERQINLMRVMLRPLLPTT